MKRLAGINAVIFGVTAIGIAMFYPELLDIGFSSLGIGASFLVLHFA